MKRLITAPTVSPNDLAALAGYHSEPESATGTGKLHTKSQASATLTSPLSSAMVKPDASKKPQPSLQPMFDQAEQSALDIRRACNSMINMAALVNAAAMSRGEIDVPFLLDAAQKITRDVLTKTNEIDHPASFAVVLKTVVHALEELCRRDDASTEMVEAHLSMIGDAIVSIAAQPATARMNSSDSYIDLTDEDSVNCSLLAASASLATFAVDVGFDPKSFIQDSMSVVIETARACTEDLRDVYTQSQSTRILFQCALRELTTLYISAWRAQIALGLDGTDRSLAAAKQNADSRFAAYAGELHLAASAGKGKVASLIPQTSHAPKATPAPALTRPKAVSAQPPRTQAQQSSPSPSQPSPDKTAKPAPTTGMRRIRPTH